MDVFKANSYQHILKLQKWMIWGYPHFMKPPNGGPQRQILFLLSIVIFQGNVPANQVGHVHILSQKITATIRWALVVKMSKLGRHYPEAAESFAHYMYCR